jgi:hypothetical protein
MSLRGWTMSTPVENVSFGFKDESFGPELSRRGLTSVGGVTDAFALPEIPEIGVLERDIPI